ncbi:MAG: hypothetical protein FJ291_24100 [Planctomycetes bacterium]|nr:hypothetical protein [Planctomycetota bacterium]
MDLSPDGLLETLRRYSALGHAKRDRRPIGDHGGNGYEYASCLAVDPHASTVLGVVHDTLISSNGPDDREGRLTGEGYRRLKAPVREPNNPLLGRRFGNWGSRL